MQSAILDFGLIPFLNDVFYLVPTRDGGGSKNARSVKDQNSNGEMNQTPQNPWGVVLEVVQPKRVCLLCVVSWMGCLVLLWAEDVHLRVFCAGVFCVLGVLVPISGS